MSIKLLWHDSQMFAHECEGCGERIKKAETHYMVGMGTFGDILLPLGQVYYYHEACFDPYMITIWLQEGQTVAVSQHSDS